MRDEGQWHHRYWRQWTEVIDGIVHLPLAQELHKAVCGVRPKHEGVAIRCGSRDLLDTRGARGAGSVFHYHRLAKICRKTKGNFS